MVLKQLIISIDISEYNIDYFIFAGHKTLYGPFGVAGFICNKDCSLEPLLYGGTGFDSANLKLPMTIPEKFEVGSPNIYAIAGLNAAIKWIMEIGPKEFLIKEKNLKNSLIECLKKYDEINVFQFENMIGVVSFIIDGYPSDTIGKIFSDHNVVLRTGLHCAPDAHRLLGTFPGGTIRASLSWFNNTDDLENFSTILNYVMSNI